MTEEQREIRRKKRVIEYAERNGNIKTACRRFGHPRVGSSTTPNERRHPPRHREDGRIPKPGFAESRSLHHRRVYVVRLSQTIGSFFEERYTREPNLDHLTDDLVASALGARVHQGHHPLLPGCRRPAHPLNFQPHCSDRDKCS